jgi:hypothetical protein
MPTMAEQVGVPRSDTPTGETVQALAVCLTLGTLFGLGWGLVGACHTEHPPGNSAWPPAISASGRDGLVL